MKRGRGRPRGTHMGGSRALAPIKNWESWHELTVALHIMQWSNSDIAKRVKKTIQHVSNVLNDPKSRAVIKATGERFRKKLAGDIDEGLLDLSAHAMKRIEETIETEGLLVGTDAKKHQDNLSMTLLKGVGFLPGAVQEDGDRNKTPIDSGLIKAFTEALKKSNKASEIQAEREEKNEILVEPAEVVV